MVFVVVFLLLIVYSWESTGSRLESYGCEYLGSPDELASPFHTVYDCGGICFCLLRDNGLMSKDYCEKYCREVSQ